MAHLNSFLKTTLSAVLLLSGMTGWGQTQLYILNFESSGGYTTSITECTDNGGDYFLRTNGSNIGATFSNIQGTSYFAAQDIDADGCPAAPSANATLTVTGISISGYTNLELRVYLAEDDDGSNEDWDPDDYVHFKVDIDNSGNFIDVLNIESDISSGSNGEPKIDTDFNGVGDGSSITDAFTQYTASIAGTGSTLDIEIEFDLDSGDEDIAIDNIEIWGTSSTSPTITLSETALNNLDYIVGNGPSAEQSFTAEGSNLTADITITAPTNFEVSTTSGSSFGSSVTLTPSSGSVGLTTIYVRLAAGLGTNNYAGTLSATSTGATQKDVSLSGDITTSSSSSIIADVGFTPTSNIAYGSYSATSSLTTGDAIKVGQFIIQDGGGAADADALSTELTAISFDITNHENIAALAIFDGTNNVSQQTTIGATTSFSGLNLSATDDGSKTFSLYATFESTVTDNQQLEFTISSATADASGSIFAAANAGGATTSTTGDANRIEVTATDLIFNQDVSNAVLNSAMVPTPTVEAYDANVNLDLDFSSSVTLTISSGSTTFDGSATTSVNAVSGVATFNDLIFATAATGNVLTASATGLVSDNSSPFDVTAPPTIIITEVADPGDVFTGRFVEIYNYGSSSIDLTAENIHFAVQVNGGTSTNSTSLSGTLDAGGIMVVGNSSNIQSNYGFAADVDYGTVNGNGDDSYHLYYGGNHSSGTLLDSYGVLGQDGTSQTWEYEDSRAIRNNPTSAVPNTTWTASEWTITSANVADMTPGALENEYRYDGHWKPRDANTNVTTLDKVIIMSNVSTTADWQAGYIDVLSGTIFTIDAGDEVEITGNLNNAGTMNVESGAVFNQSSVTGNVVNSGIINIKHNASFVQKYSGDDFNTNTGTYNVIRTETFEDQTRYSFWSSPVTGATAESVFYPGSAQTNPDDWIRWDYTLTGSNGGDWDYFYNLGGPQTTLEPGIGYGFTPTEQFPPSPNNITDTRTFSSSTINNGNINVTLTGSDGDDYALLGNPYPSDYEIYGFLYENSEITQAVYIWSDNAYDFNVDGGYYTINASGITASPSSQSVTPSNQYIAPMQGFFVQLVQFPGDRIVHFTNNQRAAGNSTFLKTDPSEYAWLSLAHESGAGNQVVVGLKDQAVAGYAQGEDSPCLKMNATMEFYVTDPAKDLTIEYRPKPAQSVDYVPLGLDAWATGTYTFALDSTRNWDAAVPVMLWDSMLGQMVDLHQTDYTFNVNFAGPIRDRFYLVLDGATVGEDELSPEADSWYWYQAGDQLHIAGATAERITLRNTHGQTVAEVSHQTNLGIEGLARGIYILEVATAGTTTAKKVVLK